MTSSDPVYCSDLWDWHRAFCLGERGSTYFWWPPMRSLAGSPGSAPFQWQLSAPPKPTALAPAQGKHIPIAQAERFQPSRVPVQAAGGKISSSGRSGFLLTAEKNIPKLLHRSMGNVSTAQWCTWVETRLFLRSLWSMGLHKKKKKKHFSSFCVYLLLLLPQTADRQERKPAKKKRVFFWSQGPNRTASHDSCRTKEVVQKTC